MSTPRWIPMVALAAAIFVFVASAQAQPRANVPQRADAAASAPGMGMHGKMDAKQREQHRKEMHQSMHDGKDAGDCKDMMDKRHKRMGGADDKDHGKGHDKAAAADGKHGGCGTMKK